MAGENEEQGPSEEIVQEARNLGWTPKEEFNGREEDWLDADAFVERGRQIVPLLRANNKRLQRELLTSQQKIGNLEKLVKDTQASVEALEKHYTAANKRAVENAKRQLVEQIKEARENGDTDAEFKLLDQLDAVKESQRAAEKTEEKKVEAGQPSNTDEPNKLDPEFVKFQEENTWFGQDKKRTKSIMRIAEDLREEGEEAIGYEFMQKCLTELKKQEGTTTQTRTPSKVEGGSRSGSRASGGKSFADLPQDAKEACWADVSTLVGDGKRYKTKADWEKQYASIYFGDAE